MEIAPLHGVYGEAWLTQLTVNQPCVGPNPTKRPIKVNACIDFFICYFICSHMLEMNMNLKDMMVLFHLLAF